MDKDTRNRLIKAFHTASAGGQHPRRADAVTAYAAEVAKTNTADVAAWGKLADAVRSDSCAGVANAIKPLIGTGHNRFLLRVLIAEVELV